MFFQESILQLKIKILSLAVFALLKGWYLLKRCFVLLSVDLQRTTQCKHTVLFTLINSLSSHYNSLQMMSFFWPWVPVQHKVKSNYFVPSASSSVVIKTLIVYVYTDKRICCTIIDQNKNYVKIVISCNYLKLNMQQFSIIMNCILG